MSFINYSSREITARSSTTGRLCGKTTNRSDLQQDQPRAEGEDDLARDGDGRTLFFDFLPWRSARFAASSALHLYTVAGRCLDASRKLILKGVDGVVFVADSQNERMEANARARNLRVNLSEQGADSSRRPS